ncbi:MAG: hypothetical protein ACTSU2_01495 [Promethearchaeota archaeon]
MMDVERIHLRKFKNLNLILILTSFFLILLAMVFYPGGYKFFEYFISDLGMKETWSGEPKPVSTILFSVGIFTLVIQIIAQNIYFLKELGIYRINENNNTPKSKNLRIGWIFGIISAIFLSGVAIFPKENNLPGITAHSFSASMFFLIILIPMLYIWNIIKKRNDFKAIKITGILYDIFLVLYLFIPLILMGFFGYCHESLIALKVTLQKLVVFTLFFYEFFVVLMMEQLIKFND